MVYRNEGTFARQTVPATTHPPQGSTDPEDLWKLLQMCEDKTGGDRLANAHNGNLSNGLMFPVINPVDGKPLTAKYAKNRAYWEPLAEPPHLFGVFPAALDVVWISERRRNEL